jgi:hypothetical protein
MEKIKEYKYIILIVAILCFSLYWFDIRVSNIRKECLDKASPDAPLSQELFWNSYKFCLTDNGLKE